MCDISVVSNVVLKMYRRGSLAVKEPLWTLSFDLLPVSTQSALVNIFSLLARPLWLLQWTCPAFKLVDSIETNHFTDVGFKFCLRSTWFQFYNDSSSDNLTPNDGIVEEFSQDDLTSGLNNCQKYLLLKRYLIWYIVLHLEISFPKPLICFEYSGLASCQKLARSAPPIYGQRLRTMEMMMWRWIPRNNRSRGEFVAVVFLGGP